MAADVRTGGNSWVSLPASSEHEGSARYSRNERNWSRCECGEPRRDVEVVSSDKGRGTSPDPCELYGGLAATCFLERHPWSYSPTTIFSPCGLVDGVVCRRNHSIHCRRGMVVEADRGLNVACKPYNRPRMAWNHGGGAVCGTRYLAVEYSQARRLTKLGVPNICVNRSSGSGIPRVLGWQDGIRKMSFQLFREEIDRPFS